MGFPTHIADEVFVRCGRHCCLCDKYAGMKMELHHIIQVADGGSDDIDNCIPLCFDCHAEVKSYNPKHPKGRQFTPNELKGHRDKCYAKYSILPKTADGVMTENVSSFLFPRNILNNKSEIVWGYPMLDKNSPIEYGSIILISGYASSGKSIYAQHILRKNIQRSTRVVYFNLKNTADEILNNIISSEAVVKVENIKNATLRDTEWTRISQAVEKLNLEYLQLVPYTVEYSMSEQLLKVIEEGCTDVVIVDDFNGLGLKNTFEIENYMYHLRSLTSKTKTTVLILMHIKNNTNRRDKRPVLSDFQDDSLYRFCDIVQFVYQDEEHNFYNPDHKKTEIITVKNSINGRTGTISVTDPDLLPDMVEIIE